MRYRIIWTLLFVLLDGSFASAQPPSRKYSNLDRLKLPRLAAVHADVAQLQLQRQSIPSRPGIHDYRAILHAHAEDSTHTGGTLPEMLADAKRAGVHCILLSDHFRPPRDFITGRWRGLREGVLFIPGSEAKGFLIHPMQSILDRMELQGRDFVETVNAGDGLIFLSHIEERPTHPIDGLTGLEIYNRHYDAKRDKLSLVALIATLTDQKKIATMQDALANYPDEVLAFQCDYPDVYLKKWDEGTKTRRLTGIAANDCHHNQILIAKMVDAETVKVGTNVDKDEDLRVITADVAPGVRELTRGRKPGDELVRLDFDPYYRAFRNVCTHILAPRLDEATIRVALKAGHAYVSHDWMTDPTGFRFEAVGPSGAIVASMGDEVSQGAVAKLRVQLPVPAKVRLLCHGREMIRSNHPVAEKQSEYEFSVSEPGAYRVEAWLQLDDEWRPWIFANPIYVR